MAVPFVNRSTIMKNATHMINNYYRRTIFIVNYREILRSHGLNYFQSEIAASVHSSRSTFWNVLNLALLLQAIRLLSPEVTNITLEKLLHLERDRKNTSHMLPDFPRIYMKLKKAVTLSWL